MNSHDTQQLNQDTQQAEAMLQQLGNAQPEVSEQFATRLENQLRSEFRAHQETVMNSTPQENTKKTTSLWRWLFYGFSGSGIALAALMTAVVVKPSGSTSTNLLSVPVGVEMEESAMQPQSKSLNRTGVSYSDFESADFTETSALSNAEPLFEFDMPDFDFDLGYPDIAPIEPPLPPSEYDDEVYFYGDDNAQLFDESVSLTIDIEQNVLDVVDQIRTETTNLEGEVVDVYYSEYSGGSVALRIPAETLTVFEGYLRDLDADGEIDVTMYDVRNVSQEVVDLDRDVEDTEQVKADVQTELDGLRSQAQLDEERIEELEDALDNLDQDIADIMQKRDEVIAEYNMVNVFLTLRESTDWLSRDYGQYDRDTFVGQIKYELSRAVNSLIKSSSGVIRFAIWIAVYSVLFIPLGLVIRAIFRRTVRKFKK